VRVSGGPVVVAGGQGGLLDVMIPRDFAQSREVFFSYAGSENGNTGTALGKGQLSADGMTASKSSGRWPRIPIRGVISAPASLRPVMARFSSPLVIAATGPLRRIEIYSYGHRNAQGASLDADGVLWVAEHGARGGDEVNKVRPGANYGWPVISYGRHYSGEKIGIGTKQDGMEKPLHYWDPSIAPSGMMIYSGKLWPAWEGDIFVGSLRDDYISRLEGPNVFEREKLQSPETGRVRDVVEGPEGAIWFLSVDNGALYKITP